MGKRSGSGSQNVIKKDAKIIQIRAPRRTPRRAARRAPRSYPGRDLGRDLSRDLDRDLRQDLLTRDLDKNPSGIRGG